MTGYGKHWSVTPHVFGSLQQAFPAPLSAGLFQVVPDQQRPTAFAHVVRLPRLVFAGTQTAFQERQMIVCFGCHEEVS